MRAPWRERLRQWICRHAGHRELTDEWGIVTCKRCRLLLRRDDV